MSHQAAWNIVDLIIALSHNMTDGQNEHKEKRIFVGQWIVLNSSSLVVLRLFRFDLVLKFCSDF